MNNPYGYGGYNQPQQQPPYWSNPQQSAYQNPYNPQSMGYPQQQPQLPIVVLQDQQTGAPIQCVQTPNGYIPLQVYLAQTQQMYPQQPMYGTAQQPQIPGRYTQGAFQERPAQGFGDIDLNGNRTNMPNQAFNPSSPPPNVQWDRPVQNTKPAPSQMFQETNMNAQPSGQARYLLAGETINKFVSDATLNNASMLELLQHLRVAFDSEIVRMSARSDSSTVETVRRLKEDHFNNELYKHFLSLMVGYTVHLVRYCGHKWGEAANKAAHEIAKGAIIEVYDKTNYLKEGIPPSEKNRLEVWRVEFDRICNDIYPTLNQLQGEHQQRMQQPAQQSMAYVAPSRNVADSGGMHIANHSGVGAEVLRDPTLQAQKAQNDVFANSVKSFGDDDALIAEIRRNMAAPNTSTPPAGAFPNSNYGLNAGHQRLDDTQPEHFYKPEFNELANAAKEPVVIKVGPASSVTDDDVNAGYGPGIAGALGDMSASKSYGEFLDDQMNDPFDEAIEEVQRQYQKSNSFVAAKAAEWQQQLDTYQAESGVEHLIGVTPTIDNNNEDTMTTKQHDHDEPEFIVDYHDLTPSERRKARGSMAGVRTCPVYLARKQRLVALKVKPNHIIQVESKEMEYKLHETELLASELDPFTGQPGDVAYAETVLDNALVPEDEEYYRNLIKEKLEKDEDVSQVLIDAPMVTVAGYVYNAHGNDYAAPVVTTLASRIGPESLHLDAAIVNYNRFTSSPYIFSGESLSTLGYITRAKTAHSIINHINTLFDAGILPSRNEAELRREITKFVNKYLRIVFHPELEMSHALNDYKELIDYLTNDPSAPQVKNFSAIVDKIYVAMANTFFKPYKYSQLQPLLEDGIEHVSITDDDSDACLAVVENITLVPFNYADYPLAFNGPVGHISRENLPKLYDVLANILESRSNDGVDKFLLVTQDNLAIEFYKSVAENELIYITREG